MTTIKGIASNRRKIVEMGYSGIEGLGDGESWHLPE
jgi:hypothetical protein